MASPEILLTEDQRLEFTQIPQNISEWEIARYYTLTENDIEIVNRHRRNYNRLGFAVQLCVLRNPGWSLGNTQEIPESILCYISEQLNINPKEFDLYFKRENTRMEHFQEIREIYGYRTYSDKDYNYLIDYLVPLAMDNDNVFRLMKAAIAELRNKMIILPGITTIERVVNEVITKADNLVIDIINNSLTESQKKSLDFIIESPNEDTKTTLAWLKEDPGQSTPNAFLEVIKRLDRIRDLKLDLNIESVHPNRIRQLSRLGSKYEPYSFRRFEDNKRYAMLALYLYDLSQTLVDLAIDIHDRQINIFLSKGRKEQESIQKQNGKFLNEKVIQFVDIGAALIKAKNESLDPFETIEAVMPWDKIIKSVEEAKNLARPINYDYIDLLDKRYSQLRKYTPALLKHLQFSSTNKSLESLIDALDVINKVNETGKRKLPEDVPSDFISNRWNKYVFEPDGNINRHYYEIAAYTELKNRIRSGDIAVNGSRNYKNFDEYLLSKNDWNDKKLLTPKIAVSLDFEHYITERMDSLNKRLQWVSKNADKLDGVSIGTDRIHVEKLEKETPEEAKLLSERLYKLLPRVKLTDLLIEVSKWTGFDKNFVHASTGNACNSQEKTILMATLMAMGTNIGLVKMSDATPGITYRQMANTAQWRMYDDAMKRSQATLVNYQYKQFLSSYWGDGSTSSSDGMRVQVGVSALNSEHNPHYGSEKGATIYRHVSDQYSSFYTKVINTNARDAVHVIDGLLYHETELSIDEHYTDTAGYTDQIFGLSHLLGFHFAPRIRDISELMLYSFNKPSNYSKIEKIIKGNINLKIIRENYDDVLRLTQSISEGKVSASLIMGKLGSYARQNSLATALREIGRIEKTIFLLDYISNKPLRRRIQRGLNKGEFMNALARAIFFGKRGELRERELQDQLQRASALNIIINAISVWNTAYLQKAIEHLKHTSSIDESLLEHIAPLGWEHINFLGEYKFELRGVHESDDLRPLNLGI
ncbi:transposase [Clostridium pasteurianum DSM 525 = ATCC 6013]|uniref:Transposase n=1 Tax=Clostridium pasteurianum DSM 525 = ATCC 6013 TaxID=1262449 RepID=A0A0H3J0F2_CLOPA|nr:Tn3 family transposase [Clostridium pasteurianum]AJA46824.1 transposase [Clostridium pasteurianum DSM 525 = ATCC 6013]AJA50812.1 transposase [Clostridium pasteurianum DSM 525 = ATCC 6013]AOZ74217.1 transposase [Clostridium pasteurianum DSM 525 = ATCC 6013]AOZ78015.1 transposase [Clostridium pasteurianum]ELP58565.1 transposase [Clostridium pasteurianum DSM 525 = ATCC 6013]